jgi:hypothetical protein
MQFVEELVQEEHCELQGEHVLFKLLAKYP